METTLNITTHIPAYRKLKKDNLHVCLCDNRRTLGETAADDAARLIRRLLEQKEELNLLFAAAPSQNEFLAALQRHDLPWNRLNALHMDEYVGLQEDAPQRFGNFLKEHIFGALPFKSVHYIFRPGAGPEETCEAYCRVLDRYPLDIVFMGIGENGHIAFNDPHVARFYDPQRVKVVVLDDVCRMQQVHDGCFPSLPAVPCQAITLTIPTMMQAPHIFCMVPGRTKANAVRNTLQAGITPQCPATILRIHPHATLYCDAESAMLLPNP